MLLTGYREEISRPTCNNTFQSLHCIAHLDQNIGEALPYLNAVLGADTYIKDPPSATFKLYGKLITVHGDKIAVNALRDEAEAHHIIEWLKEQVNDAWEKRETIIPKYDGRSVPDLLTIYRMLPRTNCKQCGQPTCMMFCSLATHGALGADDCQDISKENKVKLASYLSKFRF